MFYVVINKGEYQVRYYGWYSNKNRGLRKDSKVVTAPTPDMADADWQKLEPQSAYVKKSHLKHVVSQVEPWATLTKAVYEVDPLKCPTTKKYTT